jgi:hypothetical protein
MLAEPTFNTRELREKTVEMVFEKLASPAVFLARNAVLTSFAMGRQSSLVVDAGHEGTTGNALGYFCLCHNCMLLSKSESEFGSTHRRCARMPQTAAAHTSVPRTITPSRADWSKWRSITSMMWG